MSSVSRSTFQKLAEENKRLKAALYAITMKKDKATFLKWRTKFQEEEQFNRDIRAALLDWMDAHPDDPSVKFVKSLGVPSTD